MSPPSKPKKAKPRPKAGHPAGSAEHRIKLFVEALLSNGENVTQAAISAGFSPKSAASQGSRLLKNVKVQQIIDSRRGEIVKKYEITTDMVARSIVQDLTFDPAGLYREDGSLKALHEMDEDLRMALTAVEFEQIGSPDAPVFVRKVKWGAKQGAREQAMKHLGMFEKDNQQRSPLDGLPRDVLKLIQERLLGRS